MPRHPREAPRVDVRTVTAGAVELSVAEAGAGGRPLLLMHGFTGAKEDFTDELDRLAADGWHAVAADHRGHGASAQPPDEAAYSFSILADDAFALADALGWDRFVALGHSMGGMVLQHMLAAAPDRLSAIVLMDTAHGDLGFPREDVVKLIGIGRARGLDGLAELLASRDDPLATPAHKRLLAERPGYAEFGERKFRACSVAMYAAMLDEMCDPVDRLDALAAHAGLPALVIVGEQDRPFLGSSQRMAGALDAELAVIPDAGHSPQFENTDAWRAVLDGFLAKVAG